MEFMSSSSIPGDALKPWIPVDGSQGDIYGDVRSSSSTHVDSRLILGSQVGSS